MIDSHCHLADEAFVADASEVIRRAQDVGLRGALCILDASSEQEQGRARHVTTLWPALRMAVGVHPHHAARCADRPVRAAELVREGIGRQPTARAVGEIGLDYHYDFAPREVQQAVFRVQIQLARELDLPIVIHTRDADADTTRILREESAGVVRGVFHCFTADARLAAAALDLGFHVSFSGIVTFPGAGALREVAKHVPADRYLVETDSPYLAPPPHRGKRNEPALVTRVVEVLATVRATSPAAVAAETTANFEALFRP